MNHKIIYKSWNEKKEETKEKKMREKKKQYKNLFLYYKIIIK